MALLTCGRDERRGIFYLKTDIALDDTLLVGLAAAGTALATARVGAVAALGEALGFTGAARPLSSGTYHVVHGIGDGPGAVVMRSAVDTVFSCDLTLGIERAARRWLSAAGAERLVPETRAVAFTSEGAPFDYAVLDYVAAPTIRTAGDALLDERPAILTAIGAALAAVHRVAGRGAGLLDLDGLDAAQPAGVHAAWRDYVLLNLEAHVARCRDAGFLDAAQADRIRALFDRLAPDLAGRPMRLLHGDPGNHNLVIDPARAVIVTLLDWEDALVGDPLFEVAMWASFHPARRLAPMLAGYGLAAPSDDERRLLALYFLRIALSKTVHRLRFGTKDRPGYTPGHHRLYRGLDELEALL